ncbi:arginine--tRNA ligase [Alterileibacterium massiliense]|uniref:arginine--tRNA ligase n=1 Tax=Alterileibacterium massiliense TaxID=1870997 RepID=UPI0008DA6141|nr:arginine--tRNA ligase [Alterileibacterium massiliense]
MIDFKEEIAKQISEKCEGLQREEVKRAIEIPTDSKMGDYAFPCFKLAKVFRKSPQLIAEDIAEKLSDDDIFSKVEQVNAYVNMFINFERIAEETIGSVIKSGDKYGESNIGNNKTIIVEFSSPNIAKPFHIGHIRSTVIGNSIYKLYEKIGYKVVRINHLGDYGTQFGKLIVAYRRWGSEDELIKEPIKSLLGWYTKFHEEAEKNPELNDEARKAFANLEHGSLEEKRLWEIFRKYSLEEFERVYKLLGIKFDSYAGESFYTDKMPQIIEELKDKGLLIKSQGAEIVDLEEYDLGACMIEKSDGTSLYATRDIAAAIYRKNHYDFDKCIYVVASQQNLHFKQWKKVLELMGYEWQKDCIHVPFGLVMLEDGAMSTREGRVVFLEDVLNQAISKTKEIIDEKNPDAPNVEEISKQVGVGAVVFNELSNNRIKDYTFSWDHVLNFEGETGPYVQYTYARASSVIRNASEDDMDKVKNCNIECKYINSDSAKNLIKLIYRIPEVIIDSAYKDEPSILTRHTIDVAQAFNKFYHDEHILVDDEYERCAKLALVETSRIAIANCLKLIGIEAPERM